MNDMHEEAKARPENWEAKNDEFRAVLKNFIESYGFLRDLKYELPTEVYERVSLALLEAWFVVPLEVPPSENESATPVSPRIGLVRRLRMVEGPGDTPVLSVFTSLENARRFWGNPLPDHALISGASLCRLFFTTAQALADTKGQEGSGVPSGLVIDVSGPLPFALPLSAVVALAMGEMPQRDEP